MNHIIADAFNHDLRACSGALTHVRQHMQVATAASTADKAAADQQRCQQGTTPFTKSPVTVSVKLYKLCRAPPPLGAAATQLL